MYCTPTAGDLPEGDGLEGCARAADRRCGAQEDQHGRRGGAGGEDDGDARVDRRARHHEVRGAAAYRSTSRLVYIYRSDRACLSTHNICYLSLQVLLPTVLPEHAPFCGFAAGDVINDHDVALGYVLQVLQRT